MAVHQLRVRVAVTAAYPGQQVGVVRGTVQLGGPSLVRSVYTTAEPLVPGPARSRLQTGVRGT